MDRVEFPENLSGQPLPAEWRYLCAGLDTVQEAWDYRLHEATATDLERCRTEAADLSDDGEGLAPYIIGRELLQVRPTGAKGGFRWVAGNDDFLLMFKPGGAGWSVTVRYLAGGLWEHGVVALAERVKDILDVIGEAATDDYRRLSRADYAFDFYAPGFAKIASPRLAEAVLMPAKCKAKSVTLPHLDKVTSYTRGGRLETLTLGSKSTLQVELYHKSLEITEASGKEWMYPIWEENGLPPAMRTDVWRLEIRFGKEWLKNRNVRTLEQFLEWRCALIREAIQSRRLTVPTADRNRARWPLHPFWTIAQEEAPTPILAPFGRMVTGRRGALERQQIRNYSGGLLAMFALNNVGVLPDPDELRGELQDFAARIVGDALADPKRIEKNLTKAGERYRRVEEAR